jgi:hypothetical protein
MTTEKLSLGKAIKQGMAAWPQPPTPEARVPVPAHKPARPRRLRPPAPVAKLAVFFPRRTATLLSLPAPDHLDDLTVDAAEPYMRTGKIPRSASGEAKAIIRPGRPGPRGPEQIIAYLDRRGIKLVPWADGGFAAIAPDGGRLDAPTRDAIEAARGLLGPYLHGTPRRCASPSHVGGEPPLAVELTVGGSAWCGECDGTAP